VGGGRVDGRETGPEVKISKNKSRSFFISAREEKFVRGAVVVSLQRALFQTSFSASSCCVLKLKIHIHLRK
jgi:hypothetical protein